MRAPNTDWLALRATSPAGRQKAFLVLGGVLLIAVAVAVLGDPKTWFWDFRSAYYPAGLALLHHAPLAPLYQKGIWGFVNLPLLAYCFVPFALLPLKLAAVMFLVLGAGVTVVAYGLLAQLAGLRGSQRIWLMVLMAANGPLIYSLKLGNTSHIVLAMLAGALCLLRTRRNAAAGALLALAALIKLPLLLFGLYFLGRRNWRAAASFTLVLLIAGGVSVAIFGIRLHEVWFELAIRKFSDHTLSAFNVQSIQSVLIRLRDPAPPLSTWDLYSPGGTDRALGSLFIGLVYLVMALAVWRQVVPDRERTTTAAEQLDIEYMMVVCLTVITSPLSWTHYYCWLLLPAAFLIGGRIPPRSASVARWAAGIAVLLAMPIVMLPEIANPLLSEIYARLLVSSYFFGGVIWFVVLACCRFRI